MTSEQYRELDSDLIAIAALAADPGRVLAVVTPEYVQALPDDQLHKLVASSRRVAKLVTDEAWSRVDIGDEE